MAILLTINDNGKTTSVGDDANTLLAAVVTNKPNDTFTDEVMRKLNSSLGGMVPINTTITKERDTL